MKRGRIDIEFIVKLIMWLRRNYRVLLIFLILIVLLNYFPHPPFPSYCSYTVKISSDNNTTSKLYLPVPANERVWRI